MVVKGYIQKPCMLDLDDLKDKKLIDLIKHIYNKNINRVYIIKNKKPIARIELKDIISIFLEKKEEYNAFEFFKDNNYIECFDAETNVFDAYIQMRKNHYIFMPVCENDEMIGDVNFNILSLKISFIITKDKITGVYNKEYFDVIVNEYVDFDKPMGFIIIELDNLSIYESLYGIDMVHKVFIKVAETLKNSLRDIDFLFRVDNQFRIITFNNLEISAKILSRIQEKLNNLEIDGIKISYKSCFSHVPQMQSNILFAIEECEEELIKRD